MIKHLQPFLQRTLGVPFGEAIMPMYRFADPNRRSTTFITYTKEKRGASWWYKRTVNITHPGGYDEAHYAYFGPYTSERERNDKIEKASAIDQFRDIYEM